jgi:kynurenine aminotransferase
MLRLANLPGMWDRTVTFGSGGKTFGVTGWRIGWAIGPHHLIKFMLAIHARTVFTTPTPLQDAVAAGLEHCMKEKYFEEACADYQRRRDKAIKIFTDLGLPVATPHGSYFFMVDTTKIKVDLPQRQSEESTDPSVMETRDYAMCRWLTTEFGVTAIPPSAFYEPDNKHLAANMVRICFCKTDETLDAARERLEKLRKYIK